MSEDVRLALRRHKQNLRIGHTPTRRHGPAAVMDTANSYKERLQLKRERDEQARIDPLTGLGNALGLHDVVVAAPFIAVIDVVRLPLPGANRIDSTAWTAVRVVGAALSKAQLECFHIGLGRFTILGDSREQIDCSVRALCAELDREDVELETGKFRCKLRVTVRRGPRPAESNLM